MRHFDTLRVGPWEPSFIKVETAVQAADCINWVHDDYPEFVGPTQAGLDRYADLISPVGVDTPVPVFLLLLLHDGIFRGEWAFAGEVRTMRVQVGSHRPPPPEVLNKYLNELARKTTITTLDDIYDWYVDFETIHPFQDGNGRVGGTVVAIYSKALTGEYYVPDEGWSTRQRKR